MFITLKRLFFICTLILCFCSMGVETESTSAQEAAGKATTTSVAPVASSTPEQSNPPQDQFSQNKVNNQPMFGYPPPPPPMYMDENGNPVYGRPPPRPIEFDNNGNPIYRPPPPPYMGNSTYTGVNPNDDNKNTFTYILIFTGVILVIFIIFLIVGLKYRSKINGKIKRLEQVKDMQSLEATNIRPLTTISPTGYIEDKRDAYSTHSSLRRNNIYADSISLKSSTSDGSLYEDAYNYLSDLDYHSNVGYVNNGGYISSGQYMYNNNNMGMKYMQSSIEIPQPPQPPQPPNYEGPYHSTPASFGINKNDLDGLYQRTMEPYDTDEGVIPMKPQSVVYDTSAAISPIQNTSGVLSPSSMVMPGARYDTDLAYNNNYSGGQMMYNGAMSAVGATTSNYNQRGNRRSFSTDISRGGRRNGSEISQGLYAPANANSRAASVISETRSAKSLLIDQMVHAMEKEDESDDTLSNYPINDDNKSIASSVNGRSRVSNVSASGGPSLSRKSSNGGQFSKMTSASSQNKAANEDSSRKKKIKRESVGRREVNRDFMAHQGNNIFSQESDSCYESNNSFNQSIYDEVKVFEVEEDEDLIIDSE